MISSRRSRGDQKQPQPSEPAAAATEEEKEKERFEKRDRHAEGRAMQLLDALQQDEKAEQKRLLAAKQARKQDREGLVKRVRSGSSLVLGACTAAAVAETSVHAGGWTRAKLGVEDQHSAQPRPRRRHQPGSRRSRCSRPAGSARRAGAVGLDAGLVRERRDVAAPRLRGSCSPPPVGKAEVGASRVELASGEKATAPDRGRGGRRLRTAAPQRQVAGSILAARSLRVHVPPGEPPNRPAPAWCW